MLADEPEKGEYFLWRLMIDAVHQGRGYGRHAVELVIDYVRTRPDARELRTSYYPGAPGHPGPFYAGLGLAETGETDEDGETILSLQLV
jgi:diamine N-acetyltransferase